MISKRIASASAIVIVFVIFLQCLGIAIQSLLGRTYGAEGVGLYASFMMFISLYSIIAIFGIPSALSKYTAEYEERGEFRKIKESFFSVLVFVMLTSLIIGLLAYYITPYLAGLMNIKVTSGMAVLLFIALPFFVFSQISQSFYQGFLNALKSSLIKSSMLIGIFCLLFYSYFFVRIPVYYATAFGVVVSGSLGLLLCAKDKAITFSFSKEEMYKILRFALPLALMSYFGFIAFWIDRIAVGVYLGLAQIGMFTAGMTITRATRLIPSMLVPILIPSYSKINIHGKKSVERAFNINLKLTCVFLFFVGSLTFLYANDIISLLYGPKFDRAVIVLQILSIGTFVGAVTMPASALITGSGHPRLNLYLTLIGVPVQIALIVPLTKYYGIIGTAIANPLQSLVYLFGTIFMVSKVLNIKIHSESLMKPAFAWFVFIASYLLVFVIFKSSILAGIIGTTVYAFICWKKVLRPEDRELIKRIRYRNDKSK